MKFLSKIARTHMIAPALALAVMVPFAAAQAAPSSTSGKSGAIVVNSQSEMQSWQENATRRLNRALSRNPAERHSTPGSGIVQVSFTLDADGRPANITLRDSSAGRVAEQSAIYAVRRMGDLSDVPVNNAGEVQFLANIVFADDRAERRELTEALANSERARLASNSAEGSYIVLGG